MRLAARRAVPPVCCSHTVSVDTVQITPVNMDGRCIDIDIDTVKVGVAPV